MKKYKLVGLTGQSGSGKSTVAEFFKKENVCVISADELVTELYKPFSPCLKTISSVFGSEVINSDGTLDRKKLASLVFADAEKIKLLNSLVHPFVIALFLQKAKCEIAKGRSIIVFDAPQLFESKADVLCDATVCITADEKLRIKRICMRDKITGAQALQRINSQLSEKFFRENSDFVIENNAGLQELKILFNEMFSKLTKYKR